MAEIIPPLNKQTLARMTSGEKRFARRLEMFLEDDYLVWYDIPLGDKRRYPDFIVLHPLRGLLFLEVKDWNKDTIQTIDKSSVTLLTHSGAKTVAHPLEQVRQYTYEGINQLIKDPQLQQTVGKYKGRLAMPYGWGVVFSNINRDQMEMAISEADRESVLPDHLLIYKDEMTMSVDPEGFQERLWNMFNYNFGTQLSLPQIDRVRWHLFPEVRIDDQVTPDLFDDLDTEEEKEPEIPDLIKIMDIQQEQLAKSLGSGHRVIHGVAGSGKTLILGYRCMHLAQAVSKPILVLCYNITLAARLRRFIDARGIDHKVQIYHFHDWCIQQIKTYNVPIIESDKQIWERQVDTVIHNVELGNIPRAQYDAVLIDEGHDFEADWLKLVSQMVDPETDSLLLLYDDAQTIYQKKGKLGFSLSSVGIKAQGRTTILKLNYRNTREILSFAYNFAKHYLHPNAADDDHIPLIEPEAAGNSGPKPEFRQWATPQEEVEFVKACLKKWHQEGIAWNQMAVIYVKWSQADKLSKQLKQQHIPCLWMNDKSNKSQFDPSNDRVNLLTIYSSKGLEFSRVIIMGLGQLEEDEEHLEANARLLYVGMTRAQECLLLTSSGENEFSKKLMLNE